MKPVYTTETAIVYRANGRRYLTKSGAIRGYAKEQFRAKYPCDCIQGSYDDGYCGEICEGHAKQSQVLPRYIRRIRRALRQGRWAEYVASREEPRS